MVNISTAAELYELMTSSSTGDMSQTYTVTSNIDMTGFASESIGKYATPFTGNFNGGNFTITISNTNLANYFGFFGYFSGSGSISNCNIVYGNNFTINPNEDWVGGFIGSMSGSSTISNCNVMFGDGATITITNPAIHDSDNYGSVGGFIGIYTGTISENDNLVTHFSNCNIAFGNNATISNPIVDTNSNGTVGGFIGTFSPTVPDTINNWMCFSNCNAVFKDNARFSSVNPQQTAGVGGFVGYYVSFTNDENPSANTGGMKNCTVSIGDNANFTSPFCIGGFVGVSGTRIINSSCIYGKNARFYIDTTLAGIGGFMGGELGSICINCNAIFGPSYNFSVDDPYPGDNVIQQFCGGDNAPETTNCFTLAYGSSANSFTINGPGSAPGYANQTAVLNSYNSDSYIEWLGYKIRFDFDIAGNGSIETDPNAIKALDALYLKAMLNLSPNVPNFIKNYTIKTSNISTTYADIKNILSIQGDAISDDTPITYLEQASSYTLDNNKNYYIPVSAATLTIDGSTFTVSSNVFTGTITINFKGKNYPIRVNNIALINGIKFSNHGSGSIVLGVEETTSDGLSFWWWILIVLGIILVVFLVYYFIKYYYKKSNMTLTK
jgi:hypothetical protein